MEETLAAAAEIAAPGLQKEPLPLLYFQELLEHSMEPMLLIAGEGELLYVNKALEELAGKPRATLLQEGVSAVFPFSGGGFPSIATAFGADGTFSDTLSLLHPVEGGIPVKVNARTFFGPGGQAVASVYLKDLRPSLEAQEKIVGQQETLKVALTDLQQVLENSVDMICTFDLDGNLLHINKICEKILGYSSEELVGRHYREFIHPEDITSTQGDTQELQQTQVTYHFRNRYLHKNGSMVYLSWTSSLVKEAGKVYCIARDITSMIPAEEIRLENESRLQALLQEGFEMIAVIDEKGVFKFVSGSVKNVLGYAPEELVGMDAFTQVHPDDVAHLLEQHRQVLNGQNLLFSPFRCKNRRGAWRWLESRAVNCFHNPTINGIIVNSRDVTERLQTQRQLERSEKMYKSLFDFNPDVAYSLDTNGRFTSVNKVAVELMQMPEEEILNRHFNEFAQLDYVEHNERQFQRVLRGEAITTESSLLNANQEEVFYTFTEIPILIDGEVVGVHGLAKDITHVKRQQLLLEETAKRLNNILESIKDAFFTLDQEWRFTYVNPEFEKTMKARKEDLVGRKITEVYDPAIFEPFYRQFQRAVGKRAPIHFEEYSTYLNSWLSVTVYPSEEGFSVYVKGINSRKRAEAELKKLSLVASKTVNSVYITDEEARIEWVNDGFTRLTGYTLEEVVGRKPGDFLASPATRANVFSIREKLAIEKPFVQEVENMSKSGEVYWSKLDVTPILDEHSGGAKKFIVIETEITGQKKAEEERVRLTDELLRRNRHLEQFTYIVSHNLRSPVANVLGLTSLLMGTEDREMQLTVTDKLRHTAKGLDTIIRDLNDLLSLQGGLLEAREKISLPEIVEQALLSLPNESYQHVTIDLNGIQEIISVRSFMNSILSNLLTNAVKYRSLERPLDIKVTARLEEASNLLCLSVSDNGLGINLEKEEKNLFGLYKRFHFHVAGRGLGLYLVKMQAEALGGAVNVQSKPGVGSTFNVFVNVAES
ncbi:PAS domain S-box protein [Rufibacter quisquiliarum]|nr:PAS domain S-box protein [Rufibacter quisquiliarum]